MRGNDLENMLNDKTALPLARPSRGILDWAVFCLPVFGGLTPKTTVSENVRIQRPFATQ